MRPTNPTRTRGTLAAAVTGAITIAAAAPALAQTPAPAAATTPAPAAAPAPAKKQGRIAIASARRNVTLGSRALVQGTLRPARGGRRVQLQVRRGSRWTTVARDVTSRSGAYRLRFTPGRPSALRTRVAFAGDGQATSATRRVGTVNVFRRALASWYGPGLYGGHLACGGRLSPGTLGVAHKSLPCGTKITLRHNGRSVRVPVVDRGPYVGAREFDLTSATKNRLGFSGTGSVLTTR
jgi:rare lipoprotein A